MKQLTGRRMLIAMAVAVLFSICYANEKWPSDSPPEIAETDPELRANFESWYRERYRGIIPQDSPMGCGAAAIATVLKSEFGKDIHQDSLLHSVGKSGNEELSLLDMKRMATHVDMQLDALFAPLRAIDFLPLPGIILIDHNSAEQSNYPEMHYVVLQTIKGDEAWIKDPREGNLKWKKGELIQKWTKNASGTHGIFLKLRQP